jgi:hypothetical protein
MSEQLDVTVLFENPPPIVVEFTEDSSETTVFDSDNPVDVVLEEPLPPIVVQFQETGYVGPTGPTGPPGSTGPAGPQGPPGAILSAEGVTYTQATAETVWEFANPFAYRPDVDTYDNDGNLIYGEVSFPPGLVRVEHYFPMTGSLRLR